MYACKAQVSSDQVRLCIPIWVLYLFRCLRSFCFLGLRHAQDVLVDCDVATSSADTAPPLGVVRGRALGVERRRAPMWAPASEEWSAGERRCGFPFSMVLCGDVCFVPRCCLFATCWLTDMCCLLYLGRCMFCLLVIVSLCVCLRVCLRWGVPCLSIAGCLLIVDCFC